MGVVEDLRSHGLDITGDTATVTVEGVTQRVTIDTSSSAGVGLLIEGPVDGWAGNTPPVDAALLAAGDTEVDVTSGTARLTRHLATTDVAAVYDAVFELAKVGARIGLRLADAGATVAATTEAADAYAASSEPVSSSAAEPSLSAAQPEPSVSAAQPAAAAATTAAPWATGATSDPAVSPTTNEPTQPVSAAVAASGEFWFYVDAEQQLMSGGQGSQAVGGLRPGQWYRASREEAGWVKATDEYGRVGWVRASAAHRHQG
jgi:hypothetical protein